MFLLNNFLNSLDSHISSSFYLPSFSHFGRIANCFSNSAILSLSYLFSFCKAQFSLFKLRSSSFVFESFSFLSRVVAYPTALGSLDSFYESFSKMSSDSLAISLVYLIPFCFSSCFLYMVCWCLRTTSTFSFCVRF